MHHALYLPVAWQPGNTYPVLVEYTGNHFPACGSTGKVDDEIAALWKGFFAHEHVDGEREWPYPESDRASALVRLARLGKRDSHKEALDSQKGRSHDGG